MTQTYELLYIIPQDVTEDKVPEVTAKVDEIIQSLGAKITREDTWGRRKFAYAIKNQKYGTYQLVYFTMESENLPKLEKELQLQQNVLRSLVVKYRERSAKEIEEHEQRVAKMVEHRQRREAEKAAEEKKDETTQQNATEEETGPVDTEELEKKLDELLDDKSLEQ